MADSVSLPHEMVVDAGDPAWSRLPSRAGVAVFEGADSRTVLIAATGNVRELAKRRLEPQGEGLSKQTDVRSVTKVVRATTVGSALEADHVYLQLVRERLPITAKAVTERWQGWFAHIDPEEAYPRWTKVATTAMGEETTATGLASLVKRGVLLGPVRDKHVAARLMDVLDDLFDLCREYSLLVLAPKATACAYKEMGKCPAPCDGSEAMESYRARVREAVACAADPRAALARMEGEMRAAAARMDFEGAARCKRRAEAAAGLLSGHFKALGRLDGLAYLAVTRSEKRGWARLLRIGEGWIRGVADVRIDAAMEAMDEVRDEVTEVETGRADTLGLICTWLTGPERPGVEFLRLTEGWRGEAAKACGRVERVKRKKGPKGTEQPTGEEPMIDEHSIEPLEA